MIVFEIIVLVFLFCVCLGAGKYVFDHRYCDTNHFIPGFITFLFGSCLIGSAFAILSVLWYLISKT